MQHRWIGIGVAAVAGVLLLSPPSRADWHGEHEGGGWRGDRGWHEGRGDGGWHEHERWDRDGDWRWRRPYANQYYGPSPYYYAPPPVFYRPPGFSVFVPYR